MSRLEKLYKTMVDEAPYGFHPSIKKYIIELAEIYAKECSKASLEKASEKASTIPLQGIGFIDFSKQMVNKESIINPSNIVLL